MRQIKVEMDNCGGVLEEGVTPTIIAKIEEDGKILDQKKLTLKEPFDNFTVE